METIEVLNNGALLLGFLLVFWMLWDWRKITKKYTDEEIKDLR